MGRKNKRRKSSYARKMKVNPKRLISKPKMEKKVHRESPMSSVRMPVRGDAWFAELGEHPGTSVQEGCRPVLIISNDTANFHSNTVTVLPMTSRMKKAYLPTHVLVDSEDCPNLEPSMVLAEQVTTIGKKALKNFVGRVTQSKMREIEVAAGVHLGIGRSQ